MGRPIYVERLIDAPMERLWNATQRPEIHVRWDLRFTEIDYLPRAAENDPQRFLYATRIGFGLRIAGGRERGTVRAERRADLGTAFLVR